MDNPKMLLAEDSSPSYKLNLTSLLQVPDGYNNLDVNQWSNLPLHLIEKV
jgi:hypothetical protein